MDLIIKDCTPQEYQEHKALIDYQNARERLEKLGILPYLAKSPIAAGDPVFVGVDFAMSDPFEKPMTNGECGEFVRRVWDDLMQAIEKAPADVPVKAPMPPVTGTDAEFGYIDSRLKGGSETPQPPKTKLEDIIELRPLGKKLCELEARYDWARMSTEMKIRYNSIAHQLVNHAVSKRGAIDRLAHQQRGEHCVNDG